MRHYLDATSCKACGKVHTLYFDDSPENQYVSNVSYTFECPSTKKATAITPMIAAAEDSLFRDVAVEARKFLPA